ITNGAYLFAAEGRVEINGAKGRTLSIVPFGATAHIMESGGLKYPLHELTLRYGSTRGISNIALEDHAFIEARGRVLVIVNDAGREL
ncbi:MAG: hypothetical protein K2N74_06405, partial [Clostridiales bacterium]|nr:hypothetical protein [Clostridiales bacterium]